LNLFAYRKKMVYDDRANADLKRRMLKNDPERLSGCECCHDI